MTGPAEFLGEPSQRRNPQAWEWLKSSKVMAIAWTAMRVRLGIMWILVMWRTSSWIGLDGVIAGYRERHPAAVVTRMHLPWGTGGTAARRKAA